jgi:hypothetical protein
LNLQPFLTVEPSQCPNTCLLVISLTSALPIIPKKKLPIHRLGKNVPSSHVKPPEGLPHWTLDQVHLRLDIRSLSPSSTSDAGCMLFESSTLPEDRVNMVFDPSDVTNSTTHIIDLVDVALRLALTDLPPRALSGVKVAEKSSFKHLDNICPAMWSPGHIEVSHASIIAACRAYTDNAFNRLWLHERSFCPPSATPSPILSHNERSHFR